MMKKCYSMPSYQRVIRLAAARGMAVFCPTSLTDNLYEVNIMLLGNFAGVRHPDQLARMIAEGVLACDDNRVSENDRTLRCRLIRAGVQEIIEPVPKLAYAQAQGLVDASVLTSTREFDQRAMWSNKNPFYFFSGTRKAEIDFHTPPELREAWLVFHTALMLEPEFKGFNLIASMGSDAKSFALELSNRVGVLATNIGPFSFSFMLA